MEEEEEEIDLIEGETQAVSLEEDTPQETASSSSFSLTPLSRALWQPRVSITNHPPPPPPPSSSSSSSSLLTPAMRQKLAAKVPPTGNPPTHPPTHPPMPLISFTH